MNLRVHGDGLARTNTLTSILSTVNKSILISELLCIRLLSIHDVSQSIRFISNRTSTIILYENNVRFLAIINKKIIFVSYVDVVYSDLAVIRACVTLGRTIDALNV
jgi:hypothetical protein